MGTKKRTARRAVPARAGGPRISLAPAAGETLCVCGKPASHVLAHPDSAEWACRVPDWSKVFDAVVSETDARRSALMSVRVARRGVDHAERELAEQVARARAAGLSWHQVGLATGLTSAGARKRWHRP